jgi:peptidoglycan/LPS O-acetylase OafA/YrhL
LPIDRRHSRIDDIEILRAAAILIVVAGHLFFLFPWGPQWLRSSTIYVQTWGGVDLFFVVSGFVISRSLIPAMLAAPDRSAAMREAVSFWIRRMFRIIPAAWAWLFVILMATVFFNGSGAFGFLPNNLMDALAVLLQVFNLHVYSCAAVKQGICGSEAISMYWSLSVEEQFYLFLPIILMLVSKRYRPLAAIVVALQIALPRQWPDLAWYTRTDGLFLGVLIAATCKETWGAALEPTALGRSRILRGGFLVLALVGILVMGSNDIVPFGGGMIVLLSGVLVFAASFDKGYIATRGWLRNLLLAIGARSYSLYLAHIFGYLLTREIWFRAGVKIDDSWTAPLLASAALVCCVLTEASYRLIEQPFRQKAAAAVARYRSGASGRSLGTRREPETGLDLIAVPQAPFA